MEIYLKFFKHLGLPCNNATGKLVFQKNGLEIFILTKKFVCLIFPFKVFTLCALKYKAIFKNF